jgi:hypothetical protein
MQRFQIQVQLDKIKKLEYCDHTTIYLRIVCDYVLFFNYNTYNCVDHPITF